MQKHVTQWPQGIQVYILILTHILEMLTSHFILMRTTHAIRRNTWLLNYAYLIISKLKIYIQTNSFPLTYAVFFAFTTLNFDPLSTGTNCIFLVRKIESFNSGINFMSFNKSFWKCLEIKVIGFWSIELVIFLKECQTHWLLSPLPKVTEECIQPWPVWLSWLECRLVNWKVTGLIPTTNRSISPILSPSLLLSLKSISMPLSKDFLKVYLDSTAVHRKEKKFPQHLRFWMLTVANICTECWRLSFSTPTFNTHNLSPLLWLLCVCVLGVWKMAYDIFKFLYCKSC